MSNTGIVKVELRIDDKGVVRGFRQIGDESNTAGKKGKQAFDDMDKGAGSFNSSAKMTVQTLLKMGAGVAGILGLAKAWSIAKESAAEYLHLANEQESAETKLGSVLRATGEAAGYNLDQLKAMASSLQEVTRIGDEVTLSAMAILATFKEVKGEAFERGTKAAMDMSAVLGQDLNSAILQIGKALNDPIAGLSALGRAGVSFTENQKDTIKTLQESGDMMAAQNIILKELESEFGGAASDSAKTFAGAVDQATNALGDTKEELGFVISKNQFFIETVQMAKAEFVSWGEIIRDNRNQLMLMAKDGVLNVATSMSYLIDTGAIFSRTFELAGKTISVMLLGIERTGWQLNDALINGPISSLQAIISLYNSIPTIPDIHLPQGLLNYGESIRSSLGQSSKAIDEGVKDIWELLNRPLPGNAIRGGIEKAAQTAAQAMETEVKASSKRNSEAVTAAAEQMSEKELKALQEANQKKYAWEIASAKKISDDSWLIREKGMEEAIKRQDDMQTRMTQMEYDAAEKSKKNAKDTAKTWSDAFKGWASNMSSDLNDILWKSDSTFADIGRSFAKMVSQMIIQTQAVEPFMSWAGTGIKAAGSWLTSFFHTGGVVGVDQTPKAMVPSAMFDNAPRYHTGLMSDEFAAILRRKETVLTEGQTAAIGSALSASPVVNMKVEVINRSGTDVEVTETRTRVDGASQICSVVLDRIHRNRSYKSNFRQALGVA